MCRSALMEGASGSTGAFECEVSPAFDREAIGADLVDSNQIEVAPREVETEGTRRGIVGRAAGDDRIVMKKMDVRDCASP